MDRIDATRRPLRERVLTAIWLLAASAFLLVQLGYSFEGNDQVQYLLLPYREMYRDFLPGDWFTWSTSHYHVTFAWLVRVLHAVSGEGAFRFAMLGAHVATLAWLAYAMLRLARSLGGETIEAGSVRAQPRDGAGDFTVAGGSAHARPQAGAGEFVGSPEHERSTDADGEELRASGALERSAQAHAGGRIRSRRFFEASFALFVFGCAREKGIGEAILNHGCLLPSDLALAPFLLACAACLDRRAVATGVWLGIAGFLHANFAVLGPVVVLPVAFVQAWPELRAGATKRWSAVESSDGRAEESGRARASAVRALASTAGLSALLAAPSLIVLGGSFVAKDRDPAAVAITLFVRSPHHYDLAYMLPQEFYWTGLIVLLAVPAFIGRYALPRRAAASWLCGVLSALIIVGLIGAGFHVVSLARLFTLRMSIPLIAICLIAFACVARAIVVESAFVQREPGALIWLLTALCVLAMFVREDLQTLAPFRTPPQVPDPSAPGAPLWLIASVLAPLALATAALAGLRVRRNVAVSVLAVVPLLVSLWVARIPLGSTWTGARVRAARGFHFADRRIAWDPPDRDVYVKTRELTPGDARILIPPGLFEYRMRTRRSVFVDWKCAPMKGDEALEWKRRMLEAMGASDFPSRGYSLPQRADALYYARPLAQLVELARREGMTHLLVRKSQLRRSPAGTSIAFTTGPFAMLQLSPG